jgi:hypothetical protein
LPGVFRWRTIWTKAVFSLILRVVYSVNYQSSITKTNNKKKWYCHLKQWLIFTVEAVKDWNPIYGVYCLQSSPAMATWQNYWSHLSFTDTIHLSPFSDNLNSFCF